MSNQTKEVFVVVRRENDDVEIVGVYETPLQASRIKETFGKEEEVTIHQTYLVWNMRKIKEIKGESEKEH